MQGGCKQADDLESSCVVHGALLAVGNGCRHAACRRAVLFFVVFGREPQTRLQRSLDVGWASLLWFGVSLAREWRR